MSSIANKQQAEAFFNAIKADTDGLPPSNVDSANLIMACSLLGKLDILTRWMSKRESAAAQAALESAAGELEIRLSRTGNAISFYLDGKHVVSPTPRNLAVIVNNVDEVKEFLGKAQAFYYQETPAYTFRGKLQDAKPAAVVTMAPGKPPKLEATGAAADKLAQERGLKPVNTAASDES